MLFNQSKKNIPQITFWLWTFSGLLWPWTPMVGHVPNRRAQVLACHWNKCRPGKASSSIWLAADSKSRSACARNRFVLISIECRRCFFVTSNSTFGCFYRPKGSGKTLSTTSLQQPAKVPISSLYLWWPLKSNGRWEVESARLWDIFIRFEISKVIW